MWVFALAVPALARSDRLDALWREAASAADIAAVWAALACDAA